MLKETLSQMDIAALTTAGLMLFFVVFLGVAFFAATRTPRQAREWSRIPLTSETSEQASADE